MRAFDVHTHVVPAALPGSLRGKVGHWPSMEPAECGRRNIVIDGKVYRTLSDNCWTPAKRIEDMAGMMVERQAISPMPELFSYWMNLNAASDLVRYINDQVWSLAEQGSGRFLALGILPLQDMDCALAEMQRLRDVGFAGVEVGSNINGVPIGASEFEPFFHEVVRLNLAVFVHAVRPAGMERVRGPRPLEQVLGYPTDVGLAAASIVGANTMLKFSSLRILFSHGGGTFASLLPRLAEGFCCFGPLQEQMQLAPEQQARLMFYDTLVYDERTLQHLARMFGERQLLVGSDYPFNFHERNPATRVEQAFAAEDIRAAVLVKNAERFFGLAGEA